MLTEVRPQPELTGYGLAPIAVLESAYAAATVEALERRDALAAEEVSRAARALLASAKLESRRIVERARAEAKTCVEEARAEAETLLADARTKAEAHLEHARAEAEGLKQAERLRVEHATPEPEPEAEVSAPKDPWDLQFEPPPLSSEDLATRDLPRFFRGSRPLTSLGSR